MSISPEAALKMTKLNVMLSIISINKYQPVNLTVADWMMLLRFLFCFNLVTKSPYSMKKFGFERIVDFLTKVFHVYLDSVR